MSKQITAIFNTKDAAEAAAHTIEKKGVRRDDISVVYLTEVGEGENETTSVTDNDNISSGTMTGGAIGGVAGLMLGAGTIAVPGLGVIAAAGPVAGLISGALAGGAVGGLADLGISGNEGGNYSEEIRRGRVYFSVPITEDNGGWISKTLKENGAVSVEVHNR